ncbi:hypothetical protein Tco_0747400 [Tanacetum coccineum]|uniref:Uncharacterized protein n=1 Tax=Tanacetum coccineum TaxID=301880 RepID=A0ABQ4YSM3_9ASTR
MCDGGIEICGVSKTGNLRFWYYNYDNERRNIKGKGLSFHDFLLAKYGKSQTNALVWDNRYAEWCDISPSSEVSSQESNNPRPRDYTFIEWTLIKNPAARRQLSRPARLIIMWSSYARALIEVRADVELKDNIVVAMPKLVEEGFYTCNEECPKNIGLGVAKNLKKPSQAPRGVPVGSKARLKPVKQAYRLVSTKPTGNTSGNKKNDVEPTKNVIHLTCLIRLKMMWIWVPMGGTSNLVSKEPNSSGSLFWNVETSITSTTPIVDKIGKLEKLIIDGKVTLVDDEGEPVINIDYPIDHDSEDEVASVDNDTARSMASERVGFGTNSLLEQWRDTFKNGDYDYDPYDDDMYEGEEIPNKIQAICDNLDIKVRGRKKK